MGPPLYGATAANLSGMSHLSLPGMADSRVPNRLFAGGARADRPNGAFGQQR